MSRFDGPAFEAMYVTGARAVYERCNPGKSWDDLDEADRDIYEACSEVCLVAALSATETRDDPHRDDEGRSDSGADSVDPQPISWLWLRWAEETGVAEPGNDRWEWIVSPPTPREDRT